MIIAALRKILQFLVAFINIYVSFFFLWNANAGERLQQPRIIERFWTTRKTDDRPGVKADRGCQGNSRSRWTTSGFDAPRRMWSVPHERHPPLTASRLRIGSVRRARSIVQPRMRSSPRPMEGRWAGGARVKGHPGKWDGEKLRERREPSSVAAVEIDGTLDTANRFLGRGGSSNGSSNRSR